MPHFETLPAPRCKIGISPLSWTNDVLTDLGGDTPLEVCLDDAQAAGYAGIELGRLFPRDGEALRKLLQPRRLELASGWHSGLLAQDSVANELLRVAPHAELLQHMAAKVMVYGECGAMAEGQPLDLPMSRRRHLSAIDVDAYAQRLTNFGSAVLERWGLQLVYHHHLMMVAETLDEVSNLFDQTGASVQLLLDTGHACAAGFDYTKLIDRFGDRIGHIHLKDVRPEVMRHIRSEDSSFNTGVRHGMFTIPGDGCVDYLPLARFVRSSGYDGWLIVEAEQDPLKADPLPTVSRARSFVSRVFGS
ncbi:MAG: myo-inosose-2 dehydratase [Pseudomonadota bacterium]|jgi:inosose dehydratase